MKKRPKSDYSIQTVVNAFAIMALFEGTTSLGVTEVARRLGLHKNNAFRLLATLEAEGYVEQTDGDRYRLGRGCLKLHRWFMEARSVMAEARPVLEWLTAETGESAHLGERSGHEVVHLDAVQPSEHVMSGVRTGQRLPLHSTALGKVLLAFGSAELQERYVQKALVRGEGPATAETIGDADKLLAHLHGVAARGYALDLEECTRGLCCAAAPVYDASGALVAAVSISGPAFRLDEARLEREAAPRIVEAGERISARMGYAPGA